ncbi:MAG: hypothetical protein ACE5J0_01500 [Candidatus Paceibacterales bacterium]
MCFKRFFNLFKRLFEKEAKPEELWKEVTKEFKAVIKKNQLEEKEE